MPRRLEPREGVVDGVGAVGDGVDFWADDVDAEGGGGDDGGFGDGVGEDAAEVDGEVGGADVGV